jgi:SAM-dependent methyltransferase
MAGFYHERAPPATALTSPLPPAGRQMASWRRTGALAVPEIAPSPIRSASHPSTNDRAYALIGERLAAGSRVLDIGAGRGHMARRVAGWLQRAGASVEAQMVAADIDPAAFEAREVPFRAIDFNRPMPFDDGAFDLLYAIEVTEHLHRPYDFLAECFRLLRPGGWLVVSTPNVLELQSRLRYVLTGFWNLYQPPSIDPANAGRLCGHVMPLHLAYYDFGLRRAGFVDATYHADRRRRGAQVLYALLWPLIAWRRARFAREVERYDPAVHAENRAVLSLINGPLVMTSRSLMFCARKPGAAPGPSEPGAVV